MREFSQPELVAGILGWLEENGVADLNHRQTGAVVAAANDIIGAIDLAHTPAAPGTGLRAWLASDETGVSSLYMASVLAPAAGAGFVSPGKSSSEPWPHDPSDFGRCVGLLDAAPELRPHLSALADPAHGPVWNALAAEWDALEAWYREDSPSGWSERLSDRIRSIGDAAKGGAS